MICIDIIYDREVLKIAIIGAGLAAIVCALIMIAGGVMAVSLMRKMSNIKPPTMPIDSLINTNRRGGLNGKP